MKRIILFILALMLTVKVVTAQDDFPPDPSEIFTDAVEVVSIETQITDEGTFPRDDDNARTIRVYDVEANEWREFAYPEGLTDVYSTSLRTDGTILVYPSPHDFSNEAAGALIL